MDKVSIENIKKIPLQVFPNENGNVYHALKKTDPGYFEFGEVYFSRININSIKAWKRHREMTMNLVVPLGEVKFIFLDSFGNFRKEIIGEKNYFRLTVPPMIWFGFKGLSKPYSIVSNIANIVHDPNEAERLPLDKIKYDWIRS